MHEAWEGPEGVAAMRTGKAMKGHPDPDLHHPHGKPLKWFVFIWLRVGTFPFLIENCSSGTVSRRVGRKSPWGTWQRLPELGPGRAMTCTDAVVERRSEWF